MTKLTLHSRHGVDEYRVAIDQSFGILKNMAFKNLGDMDGIPYIRREIDGREAIIFNSMVFFAVCPE